MPIDPKQLEQELFDMNAADTQDALSTIGYTRPHFGYLGKGDNSSTIKNPERKWNREVYVYTKDGARKNRPTSVPLDPRVLIAYQDYSGNADVPVILAAPNGTDQIQVVGINGREAFNTTSGLTPMEAYIEQLVPKRAIMWHERAIKTTGAALASIYDVNQEHTIYTYQLPGANGDVFTNGFVLRAGTYTFWALGKTTANSGKVDWSLDGAAAFTTGQDWLGAANNIRKTVASVTIALSGWHKLTGTINGKNVGSGGYELLLTSYGFDPASD